MSPAEQRTLDHARAVRSRGMAMPPDGLPAPVILDSWARCIDAGLAAGAALSVPVVESADLVRRRERSAFIRRLAQAELETLSQQIAGSNFLLAFADNEGVILDLYADNRFRMSGADAGIVAGSCWHEHVAGTNGLGTALATGASVAVSGLEHYFLQLGEISCTATPVRDAHGAVVGVLDASSYFESRQRHTQALVQMAATHIENGLLMHQLRGHLVLAIHPRAEFLGTLSAGLMAFDGEGRVEALNARVRQLLSGLQATRGTRFEELFGEPYAQVLARLNQGGEVRLRDILGSSLVARLVSRPTWLVGSTAARAVRSSAPGLVSARTAMPPRLERAGGGAPLVDDPGFVAADPAVAEACRLVQAAVRMQAPILLHGETGTGKELLARHAHRCSGRRGEFVAVNCAALPADLFEAELFGYAAGAYTGARREGSIGLIASADGGTLLLDEVRELPPRLQAALLRFLDDHCVRPVGGRAARRVDVQLMAASNADLEAEARAGRFREDLLHRLNTVCARLPPLRSRRDLPQAVRWMLQQVDADARITPAAIERLAGHGWPGNFRELRAVLTRALLARPPERAGQPLTPADVEQVLPQARAPAAEGPAAGSLLQRNAAELVRSEYERVGRSVSQVSRNLGISRTTVYRHLRGAGERPL